jgi:hypothetical protein
MRPSVKPSVEPTSVLKPGSSWKTPGSPVLLLAVGEACLQRSSSITAEQPTLGKHIYFSERGASGSALVTKCEPSNSCLLVIIIIIANQFKPGASCFDMPGNIVVKEDLF